MSRRPNPGADRAAQNAQTLKALVKIEGNKVCADCKRNKHPRWASWNLGVFVCIRCSGIHRGMGTHISRVKSVDLDAWTDEQLQSILRWGNTRANKYWEAKLAPGHAPSEAKIENFIRTKYETKRWVMDGPMPDPATLDTDDDVPLNIVQEKAKIERSTSQRASQAPQRPLHPPQRAPAPNVDLFGDFEAEPVARPNTTDNVMAVAPAPPVTKPKQESLLGLDFFGSAQGAGIGRSASASPNPVAATNARGDLKNSILSLYASAPKPQPSMQQPHARQPSIGGGMMSPTTSPPPSAQQQDSFSLLTDAFSGFKFASDRPAPPAVQRPPQTTSARNFSSPVTTKAMPAAPQVTSPPPLSGGSFFESAPSKPPAPKPAASISKPSGGLDFSFTQQVTTPSPPAPKPAISSSISADLFADDDFNGFASAPAPQPAIPSVSHQAKPPPAAAVSDFGSAFNLSAAPPRQPESSQAMPSTAPPASAMFDPWGAGDANAWGAPEPARPAAPTVELGRVPTHLTPSDISGGWGAPMSSNNKPTMPPAVTPDEDFGGWTSAPTPANRGTTGKSSGGFNASPFDNPWG